MGGKNYNLSLKSLFKPFPSPWPWPSCNKPRTHSFHLLANVAERIEPHDLSSSNESCFTFVTSSFEPKSFSTSLECSVEAAMQAVSSNRLFFDDHGGKGSKQVGLVLPFEGCVAIEMVSEDVYKDFRASMKDMAEASGDGGEVKDLVWFEEMLGWYLRMNEKGTHEFIIKAYVDVVLEMTGSSHSNCSTCNRCASLSCSSFSTTSNCVSSSSYLSCLTETNEVEEEE